MMYPNRCPPCPRAKHSSQGSSSAASAARKSLFSPRTWSGWIPVTSTGMRRRGCTGVTVTFARRTCAPSH
ncbi:hypothetical protein GOA53_16695 [Sinorhizobium meliloti]|nr:hypothetical protein [Sinorhizobium meliloti]